MSGAFADGALVGARIRTLDPARPYATAVAWRDGTIIAVGSDTEVRESCDATTTIRDLHGAAVVPGLTDAHIHPFHGAELTNGADLTGLRTLPEVLAALRRERQRVGPGAWVFGHALAYEAFRDTGIDGELLEPAIGQNPTILSFFDFHTALATPSALRIAGVDGPRTFDETAEIVCDDRGVPTGELREGAAMAPVYAVVPALTHAQKLDAYALAMAAMNASGLTGGHVMLRHLGLRDVCRELEESGRLSLRLVLPLHQEPDVSDEQVDEDLRRRDANGRLWRAGAAKFFIDGVVETGTAWLYEPDTNGSGVTSFWPDPDRYASVVRRFADAGFQCITHAVGDRAVRAALDAYQGAGRPAGGAMHRIEHIETLQDHDLPRFAAEGVAASMQPLHMENNSGERTDPWSCTLGDERALRAFRTRDLLDSGAVLALGSDWPVARFDPRRGMAWCRLRREPGRPDAVPVTPGQALTALETLHGYTTGAARVIGEQHVSGRVAAGYRADLSCFAEDPVDVSADDLITLPVVATIVDGRG